MQTTTLPPFTTTTFDTLTYQALDRVGVITLNRPQVMHAISMQMRQELRTLLDDLRRDSTISAVVLTASGDKAFSAGMDLREFAKNNANIPVAEFKRFRYDNHEGIATFDKPIIAAVNGLAIGGGVELALLCDIIVAADTATFGFGEVKRGLLPGNGGTQRLTRRVGKGRALEMILTGNSISAAEALAYGLVEYCVPADQLLPKSLALAHAMAQNAPVALRLAKAAVHRGADMALQDAIQLEQDLAAFLYTTDDAKEGPRAFLEKRPPVWQGQ
jgi:enoyl-CoA hydratase/carnithine racemase